MFLSRIQVSRLVTKRFTNNFVLKELFEKDNFRVNKGKKYQAKLSIVIVLLIPIK